MTTTVKGIVSPWSNKEEWMSVYNALFSDKHAIEWALERIAVWKARSSSRFPPEIDATEALFTAKIRALSNLPNISTFNYTLLHSAALIRFIKLINDIGLKSGVESVNRAARQLGIPEWVVTLRHDVTHSNTPPFDMLILGVDFSLCWLKHHYWDKENERLNSVISVPDTTSPNIQTSVREDINKFFQLQLQENTKSTKTTAGSAIEMQHMHSIIKQHRAVFTKILTEPGYLLPSYQQLKNILNEEESVFLSNKSTIVPESLLKFCSPVLKLFKLKKTYHSLLQSLLESCQSNCTLLHRRLVAAWIVKIFHLSKAKGDKRKAYFVVPPLDWSKIVTEALICYNEYSPAYLTLVLEDSSVIIPEDKKQHLMALLAIRLGKTMDALHGTPIKEPSRVYTTDDLQKAKLCRENTELFIEEKKICWQICTDSVDWKMHTIGLLPGQKALNVFDKTDVQEESSNVTAEVESMDTCDIADVLPQRCFQEINAVEDNELSLPTKKRRVLKHIAFL